MNYQKFSLAFGFLVWLIATIIFRYWGHTFFYVDNGMLTTALFLGTIPVLYVLANWVFKHFKLVGPTRLKSAVLMAIPGMFCDVLCVKFHDLVFPLFTSEQADVLSAWILWVYAIVLLLGFSLKDRAILQ